MKFCRKYGVVSALAPNEGRNNWCHLRLQDFDFETFLDFETKQQVVPWHQWHHLVPRHRLFSTLVCTQMKIHESSDACVENESNSQ